MNIESGRVGWLPRSSAKAPVGLWNAMRRLLVASCLSALVAHPAAAQTVGVKPLIHGLIAMGDIGFHRRDDGVPKNSLDEIAQRPGLLRGVVVNITWSQLQPRPDALDPSAIDSALDAVRAYNRRFPQAPLAVKLRIWPGPNAPEWAKTLGGPPVPILHITGDQTLRITVGRYWSAPYRQAWSRLQQALAEKYDSDPLIREVSITSCSSQTDEPFVESGDPESVETMRAAGYSDAAFEACLMGSPADYLGWKATRVDFAFSPFRRFDSGRPKVDLPVTFRVMAAFRQAFGPRAILTNHALQDRPPPFLMPIYEKVHEMGPPIEFQTHSPKELDWDDTIRMARSLGAGAIEVWQGAKLGGFETMPPEKLKAWDAEFEREGP